MTLRRVVITGLGLVTSAGGSVRQAWHGLTAGRSSVHRIQRFDASGFPTQIAGQISDEIVATLAGWPGRADCGLIARYAAAAAAEAIRDASLLDDRVDRRRIGVAIAAGMGRYEHPEVFIPCAEASRAGKQTFDWRALAAALVREARPGGAARRTPGSIPASIAAAYELAGPTMAVMTACAGGTQALGDAMRWIRTGRADAVLAGGADSEIYPMGLASFCLLGALSTRNDDPGRASRPFEAGRDGFVLGEGAGMLVLEERERALSRGATIYAEAAGFGSACDAYRATDPHPDGAGAVLAMRRALDGAGVPPADVDYINAHGTSTPANDRAETAAIKYVFGKHARRLAISSTKSMIGHATVAAGAIEAVVAALTLRDQIIHPTINYETPDADCDLDYVPNRARAASVRIALSNSFAFGGQAACLALRRHEA